MEIDYNALEKEIFNLLGDSKIFALATASQNRVTVRNMSCVIINRKIYFQTGNKFIKYEQMLENPNVAMCIDNIQIEGTARLKKHPFNEENKEFIYAYEKNYKGSYDNYSHLEDEVVVEVKPTLITLWKYEDGHPFRDFLDFTAKLAYRVMQ